MHSHNDTRPIIVGIDGSDAADRAARWAADLAARVHAPLRLVHAVPPVHPYVTDVLIATTTELADAMRQRGVDLLAGAQDVVTAAQPSVEVDTALTDAAFSAYVDNVSEHSQLIVLGSRRSGPLRDVLLGGQSIRILNHSNCPVLLWRDDMTDAPGSARPVVVGIDESASAAHALLAACDYAQALGAPLVVSHYWRMAGVEGTGYAAAFVDWEKVQEERDGWMTRQIEPLREKFPDVDIQSVCHRASPTIALRSMSESAQLVVVGTRGHGRLVGTAIGSVSQNLAHHSHCSVLVVR